MSIAIRIGQSGQKSSALFYLNTTTRYQTNYRSQTSKYPLDAGVSITDHVVNENPVIQVSGIISPADISIRTSNLTVQGEIPMNNNRFFSDNANTQIETLLAGLKNYLPDVATQFLSSTTPTLQGGQEPDDRTSDILDKVKDLFTRLTYNRRNQSYNNSVVLCTLFELSNTGLRKDVKNLVLTEFTGRYEPDHGDALLVDMTFEQVRFVNLQQTTVPRYVSQAISMETAIMAKETEDKGDSNRSSFKQILDPQEDEKKGLLAKLAQQTVGVLPL